MHTWDCSDTSTTRRRHRHVCRSLAVGLWLGLHSTVALAAEASSATEKDHELVTRSSDSDAPYGRLIARFAGSTGLPVAVADAVMAVESGYDPHAVGSSGEIGLMQVMPATAAMLGFTGTTAELAVPETNIRYGVAYLAKSWLIAGGDLCTAMMKYRAGHSETRFSARSVDYCLAVRARLAARGYPVSGRVPIATFGERARPHSCKSACLAGSVGTVPNLDVLNKRLSEATRQTNIFVTAASGAKL